ncbi:RNA-directed DNA polymerase (Reverse transcriptase), partial [Trifolium medium]|nr:RNA-directed DNA polymerase (Reverse transcriptase) [Trifolium medium]
QISDSGYNDNLLDQEKAAQVDLDKTLKLEEEFWREKARVKWLADGDRNTAYFHKIAKIRHVTKNISVLRHGDDLLTDPDAIENHVVSYYNSIFNTDNNCLDNGLVDKVIPNMLNEAMNDMLTKLPSLEEVKDVVFGMNSNGAPGPDGYGAYFFQNYWNIVGHDV